VVEFDLLATVLDGLDQGLVAYDRNLRIVAANARAYEILDLLRCIKAAILIVERQ
tara:strand:- start:2026 stop:2190 length:165 start_codon:yes stop_codon:yes gene_type:complete